jgi:hypothetical protein|nr:hypothetical protein [uncultured Rhodoferax sp.]
MGIRSSIWAALGRSEPSDSADVALERVRKAMLLVVEEYGGDNHIRLDMKINFAREIAELWFLRPELMHVVAAAQGEQVAQECMAEITALFKKHHLGGTPSRFGKL